MGEGLASPQHGFALSLASAAIDALPRLPEQRGARWVTPSPLARCPVASGSHHGIPGGGGAVVPGRKSKGRDEGGRD